MGWTGRIGRAGRALALGLGSALVVVSAGCAAGEGGLDDAFWSDYARVVAVEDARGTLPADALVELAASGHPRVRPWAVRGLGRLGDPTLAPRVERFLEDPDPEVRIEAAHALAELRGEAPAVDAGPGAAEDRAAEDPVPAILQARAEDGSEELRVRAEAAHALVRSAAGPDELAAPDSVLAELSVHSAMAAPGAADARLALARAWEIRARRGRQGWSTETAVPALHALEAAAQQDADPYARRLAVATLRVLGALQGDALARALDDPDAEVRRQGVMALGVGMAGSGDRREIGGVPDSTGTDADPSDLAARLEAALADPDATVRMEALGQWDRALRADRGCAPILAAAGDDHPYVARAALDLLAGTCPEAETLARRATLARTVEAGLSTAAGPDAASRPDAAAEPVAAEPEAAGRGAHALAALTTVDPAAAREHVVAYAGHPSPFIRARAAGTAAALGETTLLRTLATDPDPNVRTAALRGLGDLEGHAADSVYRAQLASTDAQLVLTAVGLLEGTPEPEAPARAMTAALLRFSATRRETVRDVRLALLDGLEAVSGQGGQEVAGRDAEVGGGLDVETLRPLVRDYDPVVAERAAELVAALTGEAVEAEPRPLPRVASPDAAELEALARTTVILEMAGGGEIAVRPLPEQAATNAARFVRLAREGRFDGLTFHRVVPDFIIQGGSPGANEYAGYDRFSRDELGRTSHRAGTVGLSTRGRDTGDGQIFINLVDNPRLDFAYTVFGELAGGLDVARRVVEGGVIRRVRVEEAATPRTAPEDPG